MKRDLFTEKFLEELGHWQEFVPQEFFSWLFKHLGLAHREEEALGLRMRKSFVSWVREMVLLIPGKLVRRGRRYFLKLPRSWPFKGYHLRAKLG